MGTGFFLSVHDIINSISSFCSEENYLHFLYVHAINVRNPWNNSLLFPAPSQKSSHFSWSVQPRSGHITPVAVEPVIHGDLPWLPRFYTFILRISIYKTQDSVLAATTSTNHVNDLHTHICSFILHGVVPSSLNCLSFFRFKFNFFSALNFIYLMFAHSASLPISFWKLLLFSSIHFASKFSGVWKFEHPVHPSPSHSYISRKHCSDSQGALLSSCTSLKTCHLQLLSISCHLVNFLSVGLMPLFDMTCYQPHIKHFMNLLLKICIFINCILLAELLCYIIRKLKLFKMDLPLTNLCWLWITNSQLPK